MCFRLVFIVYFAKDYQILNFKNLGFHYLMNVVRCRDCVLIPRIVNWKILKIVFTSTPENLEIKNLFMLSVRISSYGCTREVWRARKMRKS